MKEKEKANPSRWGSLAEAMPGVARLLAEKRSKYGNEHVNECWRRSMVLHEPGWLFAREGAIAIGTPWADPLLANFAAANVTSTQALVIIRMPEVTHGTN